VAEPAEPILRQQHQRHWRHYPVAVSFTHASGQTHLGRWSSLYHSLRQRSYPRHREIPAWTNSRLTGHTGTLGDRRTAQQPVVGRRQSTATAGEHLPRPAVRQLQHGARLVPDLSTHYHLELARGVGREVDCAG